MSEPVFRGDDEDKITHSQCGKRESFMPEYAGNLFYWYCPVCKEYFVPARQSPFAPVQCLDSDSATMADVMRGMLEPMDLKPSPVGTGPVEAFYVIRKDSVERVWLLVNTPAGAHHFDTREAALAAARAAADNPTYPEVRVLRCAQEVLSIMKGASAAPSKT